jgi:spore coat protein U-like protein
MSSRKLGGLVAIALASIYGNAYAVDAIADLNVSATVPTDCAISTTAVAFGAYKPLTTNLSVPLDVSTGKITVTCANGGAGATIALGAGVNGTTAITRKMKSTATVGDTLAYQLYQPTDFTTVWGITGVTGVAAIADGASHDYTVNARIAPNLNLTVVHADYTDTVVATVSF